MPIGRGANTYEWIDNWAKVLNSEPAQIWASTSCKWLIWRIKDNKHDDYQVTKQDDPLNIYYDL